MATGAIHPSEGWQNNIEMEELARFAVDEYNKKQNTLLELKEIKDVKEQVVAGTVYYITILVSECGQKKVYEAKIWVQPWRNFKELQEFNLVDA